MREVFHEKIIKKGDIYIFLFSILMFCGFLAIRLFAKPGGVVVVSSNGEKASYSLDEDREICVINDENKGKNTIVIKDGCVYMKDADCPDLICVRHKSISKNGECIICLPNDVYIEVVSDKLKDIDN